VHPNIVLNDDRVPGIAAEQPTVAVVRAIPAGYLPTATAETNLVDTPLVLAREDFLGHLQRRPVAVKYDLERLLSARSERRQARRKSPREHIEMAMEETGNHECRVGGSVIAWLAATRAFVSGWAHESGT